LGNINGEARETKGKLQEDETNEANIGKETVAQSDKEQKQTRHDNQKQCTTTTNNLRQPTQHNPTQQNETQDRRRNKCLFHFDRLHLHMTGICIFDRCLALRK
jgi:hypothetical protein